jgi:hypothetical protein
MQERGEKAEAKESVVATASERDNIVLVRFVKSKSADHCKIQDPVQS